VVTPSLTRTVEGRDDLIGAAASVLSWVTSARRDETKIVSSDNYIDDARGMHFGQPVVPNGVPLSKIHHAAFDAHLIYIDPDYRLRVSDQLLVQSEGPMLEALKRQDGGMIHLPGRIKDRPDRDRLAQRFGRFKAAA
jgi:putative restriction endonuclease